MCIVLSYFIFYGLLSEINLDDDDDGGGGGGGDTWQYILYFSAPAKMNATSPNRQLQQSQTTMQDRTMRPTNDLAYCTVIGCCCVSPTSTTYRWHPQY